MSFQVYSVPGQTEGRSKASHEVSLTCWDNVNYYRGVHHPIPTRENREHPGSNFQNRSVSSAFN